MTTPHCPHLDRAYEYAVTDISGRTPDAVTVACPCCKLPGYYTPDDAPTPDDPMTCPYCGIEAVEVMR
jgi:hypothetical protein